MINEKSLKNLIPNRSTNANGGTRPVTVKLEPEDIESLRTLPSGLSFNIRQAVKDYLKKLSQNA